MQLKYSLHQTAKLLNHGTRSLQTLSDESGLNIVRAATGQRARQYSAENIFDLATYIRSQNAARSKPLPRRAVTCHIPRGGSGKTLTATNLAVLFSALGVKTCLVDLDWQGSASSIFGYDPDVDSAIAAARGISADKAVDYHIGHMLGLQGAPRVPFSSVVKYPFGINGPALIPADVTLNQIEATLTVERLNSDRADLVFFDWMKKTPELLLYELVIFDSGPGFSRTVNAALSSCDMVIAPVGLESISEKGLRMLKSQIKTINERQKSSIEIRIIPNGMVNTKRSLQELGAISTGYPGLVIPYPIKRSEDVPKAYTHEKEDRSDPLMPFALKYPLSEVTQSLSHITQIIGSELWPDGGFEK